MIKQNIALRHSLEKKEQIEIEFWEKSQFESPKHFSPQNLNNKLQECVNLDYKINKYLPYVSGKKNVLEVGSGQGWASCYMKHKFLPDANFTVTDISKFAVESVRYWEEHFDVKMTKTYASKSYSIGEQDESFDLIFCYSAAHHFVLIEETLTELKRLLTKDGHIIFFYEPTCSLLLYPLFYRYVNSMPHSTPEDVLIPSKIKRMCKTIGLQYENNYDTKVVIDRNKRTTQYFNLLNSFPFLQHLVPSSSDLVFQLK